MAQSLRFECTGTAATDGHLKVCFSQHRSVPVAVWQDIDVRNEQLKRRVVKIVPSFMRRAWGWRKREKRVLVQVKVATLKHIAGVVLQARVGFAGEQRIAKTIRP